jgi:maltooligosyltrehalose trehalohydrolase
VALATTSPLGAIPVETGRVGLRVWAPQARSVAARLASGDHALADEGDGIWAGAVPAAVGDDYRFVLDGGESWPDPCSRFQPEGVRGPSRVVDTSAFRIAPGPRLTLEELVLYELHVGTFSAEGSFDGLLPRLGALRELGVTAIELMPVATFPGSRGWGYDGVYTSAVHPVYGGPVGLARLVDAAHRRGLGVVLDVVYNHLGPGDRALRAFGPYGTDRVAGTPWGATLDYTQSGVREWAIQNAELWVRDYRVDGLRLDSVPHVYDESPRHVLAELADRVRAVNPSALVISEVGPPDFRPLTEWGHDALWLDNLHHALHVALTGERDGYYASFDGSMGSIAAELVRPEGARIVACAQNHDQVGNRALGDRLPAAKRRVAAAVVLFSPLTPLLFQGEEWGETAPFRFFTDHDDPFFADATREGRRREFARFAGFDGNVPDPQALESFELSRLTPAEPEDLYVQLLRLRRELPRELEVGVDERARTLELRRGRATLRVDFAAETVELHA